MVWERVVLAWTGIQPGRWRSAEGFKEFARLLMRWGLGEGKGEKDGSGRVTAVGTAGLGSRFGPGEGARETFWVVSKP